ncbi:AAA family ATPase, partial [Paenibacillus sp. GCM10012307]
MLRIDKLFVKNVNNLKEIEINFNEHFNIICGQNGTGKTTLLNCLLGSFKKKKLGSLNVNAMDYHGFWEIKFYNNNEPHYRVHYIDTDVNIKDNLNIKGDKLISTNYII